MERQPSDSCSSGPGSQSSGLGSCLACMVCHNEIPVSAATWRESSDYVAHFCGFECYERWRNQESAADDRGPTPSSNGAGNGDLVR